MGGLAGRSQKARGRPVEWTNEKAADALVEGTLGREEPERKKKRRKE